MRVRRVKTHPSGYAELALVPMQGALPEMEPGQFVNILVEDVPGAFLRRPISINDVCDGELRLLVKDAGRATSRLCRSQQGDVYNVLLPLGTGFDTDPGATGEVLLVGGGVGTAPMLYLGRKLSERGVRVNFLLGARTETELVQNEQFASLGHLEICTEDGSAGVQGFVTANPVLDRPYARIYVCGPLPMMKAVAAVASSRGVDCQVSLENKMACGLGACLCCVEDTQQGHVCTCTDGPVFDIKELKWQI